jgi:hypothetical protein
MAAILGLSEGWWIGSGIDLGVLDEPGSGRSRPFQDGGWQLRGLQSGAERLGFLIG